MRHGAALALAGVTTAQLLVPPKKMVFRTRDPLTGETSADWRKALSIDGFPTFMGVAESNEKSEDDVLATMRWYIIPETGVVLLNPLVPLHYIYRHQHNAVVGSVWSKPVWKSTSELGYLRNVVWTFVSPHAIEPTRSRGKRRANGVELPRHRADAATETTSRRWRGAPEI
jgi:hypothetical protein